MKFQTRCAVSFTLLLLAIGALLGCTKEEGGDGQQANVAPPPPVNVQPDPTASAQSDSSSSDRTEPAPEPKEEEPVTYDRESGIAALEEAKVKVEFVTEKLEDGTEEEHVKTINFWSSRVLELDQAGDAQRVGNMLAPITDMERLWFQRRIHADCLSGVENMTNLKQLSASLDNDGFAAIAGVTSLEELTTALGSHACNDEALPHLKNLVNLKELELRGAQISDEGLSNLAPLASLESLNLQRTPVTGTGLAHLSCGDTLKTLWLGDSGLTDEGLKQVAAFPNITFLELKRTKITDEGLAELQKLPALRSLSMEGTTVTGKGLKGVKVEFSLDAEKSSFDDSGLEALSETSPPPKMLELAESKVTDAGLIHLAKMTDVSTVYLKETAVTQEGVNKLKEALPKCTVDWEPPE